MNEKLPLKYSYSKILRGGIGGGGGGSYPQTSYRRVTLKFQYRLFKDLAAHGVGLRGVYTDTNLRARAT